MVWLYLTAGAGVGPNSAGDVPPPEPPVKKPKAKANGKPKNQLPAGEDGPKKKGHGEEQPTMKSALASALKTKKAFQCATSAAISTLESVESDEAWSWARNKVLTGPVTKAKDALNSAVDTFARLFVSQEFADIKRKFGHGTLVGLLSKFSLDLDTLIGELQLQTTMLQRMHAARGK